ncbi:ABC transporter permease [Paeniglutamicibacter psychrophenolicus]|uniref:ABC transporter permease n=1 Tax=Paeniglutamicibacter psychrophenolicus TaxID=257454 RepID=UPI002786DAC7|nr:ABC transporter permease [Paeniglutamicibacter psychrophenolicus]MDQ0092974.1 ABC-type nitrate/sulfonate/bicarbonate transport system permease component [Paeniglutamicibacter psychrophenolicus]
MKILKSFGYLLGLPLILLTWWWLATSGAPNFFVPTPAKLVTTFIETWFGERMLTDVLPSIMRLVVGVLAAIVLGIVLGLAVGLNRTLRAVTEPVFEFFRALPPPVLVPVLMLLVGINDGMKVAVIISGCIWPVLLNTIEGVRSIDPVQNETSRSYGITGFSRIRYQILPSATPTIMAGVRQALSIGLILMVISEMFASSSGLGFTIVQFQRSFAVPEMWSGIVVLGLIGVALSFIFQWVQRRVLRWYHGLKEVENAV